MVTETNVILIQMECMLFFEANPFALETISSLSVRLGRGKDSIIKVMERLTELSLVEKFGDGETAIFRYKAPFDKSDVSIV